MRSRTKKIEELPAPAANHEDQISSNEGGTFSAITNLFSDTEDEKKSIKPPLRRLPFKHIGFYQSPATQNRSFNWEAKVLQSKRDLEDLYKYFNSKQLASAFPEFQNKTVIALLHTSFRANSAIRIGKVMHDDTLTILSEQLDTNAGCSILSSSDTNHYLHIISIPSGIVNPNSSVNVKVLGQYEACLPTLSWKQKTYSPVNYKTIHYEANSKRPWKYPSPRILSFNNNWGEWDLLQKNYCPSCSQVVIPEKGGMLAVIDGAGIPRDYGRSHLVIDKLYKNNQYVGIEIKRIVELCKDVEPNYPMILLQVNKDSLGIEDAFKKSHVFRLSSGFIPEDQVACGNYENSTEHHIN